MRATREKIGAGLAAKEKHPGYYVCFSDLRRSAREKERRQAGMTRKAKGRGAGGQAGKEEMRTKQVETERHEELWRDGTLWVWRPDLNETCWEVVLYVQHNNRLPIQRKHGHRNNKTKRLSLLFQKKGRRPVDLCITMIRTSFWIDPSKQREEQQDKKNGLHKTV